MPVLTLRLTAVKMPLVVFWLVTLYGPRKWKQYVSPIAYQPTSLYGVTTQKTTMDSS
jgi:hypothetical protein